MDPTRAKDWNKKTSDHTIKKVTGFEGGRKGRCINQEAAVAHTALKRKEKKAVRAFVTRLSAMLSGIKVKGSVMPDWRRQSRILARGQGTVTAW